MLAAFFYVFVSNFIAIITFLVCQKAVMLCHKDPSYVCGVYVYYSVWQFYEDHMFIFQGGFFFFY